MARHKAKVSKERQANKAFQAMVTEHAQSIQNRLEELRIGRVEAPQVSCQVAMAPPRSLVAKEAPYYQSHGFFLILLVVR